jgi:hypothetical protein
MLCDHAEGKVSADERVERTADARVSDEYPHRRDLEREPGIHDLEGKERVIYFVSRRLLDAETRYSPIERLCLCLYFSCTKIRH